MPGPTRSRPRYRGPVGVSAKRKLLRNRAAHLVSGVTGVTPAVGELVRCTDGPWMVRPPERCRHGHPHLPGRTIIGAIPCSCGRHLTWACECGAVTYGPALAEGCSLLDGPARVREKHQGRKDPWYTTTSASVSLYSVAARPVPLLGTLLPHGCLNSRFARHAPAVADLLGHSSISVTGDVYGHPSDDAPPRRYRGV
jgi:hypothetical protein